MINNDETHHTSAKNVTLYLAFVCYQLRIKTTDGIRANFFLVFLTMNLRTKKILFNFGSYLYVDLKVGIFLTDLATLQDTAFFHNSACISGKTDRIFMKILPAMYLRTRKFT